MDFKRTVKQGKTPAEFCTYNQSASLGGRKVSFRKGKSSLVMLYASEISSGSKFNAQVQNRDWRKIVAAVKCYGIDVKSAHKGIRSRDETVAAFKIDWK